MEAVCLYVPASACMRLEERRCLGCCNVLLDRHASLCGEMVEFMLSHAVSDGRY